MTLPQPVEPCPLCGIQPNTFPVDHIGRGIRCPRCGQYEISHLLALGLRNVEAEQKARLSCCTKQKSQQGETVILNVDNWQELARAHGNIGIAAQRYRLLETIAERSGGRPAKQAEVNLTLDYPLFDCFSQAEFSWLLQSLADDGLLEWHDGERQCAITLAGWNVISPLTGAGREGLGFVAMSFARDLDFIFDEGIKPAIENDCKLKAFRVDRAHHNERIDDYIISRIRGSQFMVADFTGNRAGVYFEAGFALGLGRVVIWTCKEGDDMARVHFDTRQYNHIVWSDVMDLRSKLRNRIRATVQLLAAPE